MATANRRKNLFPTKDSELGLFDEEDTDEAAMEAAVRSASICAAGQVASGKCEL